MINSYRHLKQVVLTPKSPWSDITHERQEGGFGYDFRDEWSFHAADWDVTIEFDVDEKFQKVSQLIGDELATKVLDTLKEFDK